ncbi:hypothetical protein [Phaeodactylibacter luteus]|nr:hypothetical protein [Phaeodactylibacter luteus]
MTLTANWQPLTVHQPQQLNDTIKQLHMASQHVAAFGHSLLPEASDDSQSSMNWVAGKRALASQEVNLKRRVRIALAYDKFELQMINENDDTLGVFPLSGQNPSTALSFVRTQARSMGLSGQDVQPISHFELPAHPTQNGAPYMMTSPKLHQEAARYRQNATVLLQQLAAQYEYASDVATWPHHFDTGSVITVKFDDTSNPEKTIGMGFAPADDNCPEPYFYVSHWMKKGDAEYTALPGLPKGGEWKTGAWKGALLPASAVVSFSEGADQFELAGQFFKKGIEASLEILEETAVKA